MPREAGPLERCQPDTEPTTTDALVHADAFTQPNIDAVSQFNHDAFTESNTCGKHRFIWH